MIALLMMLAVAGDVNAEFADVRIESPFDKYLAASPLLMETAGAKIIRTEDGSLVVVGVGVTPLKDSSAVERLRATKVAKTKAQVAIVGEQEGVQVAQTEILEDRIVVKLENGEEKAHSVSDFLSVTKATIQGMARGMKVVGHWKSKDGELFYVAIGKVLPPKP